MRQHLQHEQIRWPPLALQLRDSWKTTPWALPRQGRALLPCSIANDDGESMRDVARKTGASRLGAASGSRQRLRMLQWRRASWT